LAKPFAAVFAAGAVAAGAPLMTGAGTRGLALAVGAGARGVTVAVGAERVVGTGVGVPVCAGVPIVRGAIGTPARTSAGPCGAGVGVGLGCGRLNVRGEAAAVSPAVSTPAIANAMAEQKSGLETICGKVCTGGQMILQGLGLLGLHIDNCLPRSRCRLAPASLSRQQRGMESTHEPTDPSGEAKENAARAPQFLGKDTPLPQSPEEAVLDYVPNPRKGALYLVRFVSPEFTSLCPVTNQPDFAHLVIDYAPDETIVESKSLKLFLGSFRNHNGFHEDVTVGIGQRLFDEMQPKWLRIGGYWYPRGGIPIDVFWQSGAPPKDLWLPDQGVASYRGRG
jgi:7-cyano-7-deazaguanine reductase